MTLNLLTTLTPIQGAAVGKGSHQAPILLVHFSRQVQPVRLPLAHCLRSPLFPAISVQWQVQELLQLCFQFLTNDIAAAAVTHALMIWP